MAYLKPQSPIKYKENYYYPLTRADQVLLTDGSRLEKNGKIIADKLAETKIISLYGDVVGNVDFDGSESVSIETKVYASKTYTVTLSANSWSASAPYTQKISINGMKVTDNPIIDVNMSTATTDNNEDILSAWALVGRISTGDGFITAYCYNEKPEIDLLINLITIK